MLALLQEGEGLSQGEAPSRRVFGERCERVPEHLSGEGIAIARLAFFVLTFGRFENHGFLLSLLRRAEVSLGAAGGARGRER